MPPLSFEQKQFKISDLKVKTIRHWYAGKKIFITGATGFVGKVLVERFLRSCPDLDCIYMLIRTKKGVHPMSRFADYSNQICFSKLREKNPEAFNKLKLIRGDILEESLGISAIDRKELADNVNVVIHCAATVKFNLPLKESIDFNVLGTYKVLELSKEMKNLASFVHVSTAFSQHSGIKLEEKLYQTNFDPLEVMQIAKLLDNDLMQLLKPKLMEGRPNTYTYSKGLAECLVSKYASILPVTIARPSIIVVAKSEPLPGYTEYFHGPNGLCLGGAHGVLRCMYARGDCKSTYVPVDYVANACIVIAWDRGLRKDTSVQVYNIADTENSLDWDEALTIANHEITTNYPYSKMMWYPFGRNYSTWYEFKIRAFFLHFIPGFLIDLLLFMTFQKPQMIKLYKKVNAGMLEYGPFTTEYWEFKNENLKKLFKTMSTEDQEMFPFNVWALDWPQYLKIFAVGLRTYLAKDPPETIPQAKKTLRRLYILDKIVKYLLISTVLWLSYKYFGEHFNIVLANFDVTKTFIKPVKADNL